MAFKNEYFYYQSKNNVTGVTDITATIERNGVQVATGVALTQVNSTTQPGVYRLVLTPSMITGYGGSGVYEVYLNSASLLLNAASIAKQTILSINPEDLDSHLTLQDTAIAAVKSDTSTTLTAVQDPNSGLAALATWISSLQSAVMSIQNNTTFVASVPPTSVRPQSGSTTYRIPLSIYNTSGVQVDPTSNQIQVTLWNPSGIDRSSYLTGYNSPPGYALAVRDSVGNYHIDYTIASNAPLEQLIIQFVYSQGGNSFTQRRTTDVTTDVQISGYALETTSQSILADTMDIRTKINNATYGLSAIQALITTVNTNTSALQGILQNSTYGLSAIKTILDTKASQSSVDTANAQLIAIEGTGFNTNTDSLAQISARLFTGGRAI